MDFPYPVALAGGVDLVVIDYRTAIASTSPAAANGATLTATFPPVDERFLWLVQRITITCTSTSETTCAVYAGDAGPQNLADVSAFGNLDVADEASPIFVDATRQLTVVWTGADAGAVGTARIQYQLAQRTS